MLVRPWGNNCLILEAKTFKISSKRLPKSLKYRGCGADAFMERSWAPKGCSHPSFPRLPRHRRKKNAPKVTRREPTGAKGKPKVSQRATKMHKKINLRKRSRKLSKKGAPPGLTTIRFGDHFRPKIEKMSSKTACKIRCRKSTEN